MKNSWPEPRSHCRRQNMPTRRSWSYTETARTSRTFTCISEKKLVPLLYLWVFSCCIFEIHWNLLMVPEYTFSSYIFSICYIVNITSFFLYSFQAISCAAVIVLSLRVQIACLCTVYLLMRLYITPGCLTASLALAATWDGLWMQTS